MKIYYFLDWYDDSMPLKIREQLSLDITNRKSLVMISGDPLNRESYENDDYAELEWLKQANIHFEDYHFIDNKTTISDVQALIRNASVIFLFGGYTIDQRTFLYDYNLRGLIQDSDAIIMGTSAGAINMGSQWLCSKHNRYDVSETVIYDGLGLADFSFQPHFDHSNLTLMNDELLPLSETVDIYAPFKEGAVRVVDGMINLIGTVHLISKSKITEYTK